MIALTSRKRAAGPTAAKLVSKICFSMGVSLKQVVKRQRRNVGNVARGHPLRHEAVDHAPVHHEHDASIARDKGHAAQLLGLEASREIQHLECGSAALDRRDGTQLRCNGIIRATARVAANSSNRTRSRRTARSRWTAHAWCDSGGGYVCGPLSESCRYAHPITGMSFRAARGTCASMSRTQSSGRAECFSAQRIASPLSFVPGDRSATPKIWRAWGSSDVTVSTSAT